MTTGQGGGDGDGPELLDSGPAVTAGRRLLVLGLVGVVALVLVGFSLSTRGDGLSVPPPSSSPPVERPTTRSPSRSPSPSPTPVPTAPVLTRGDGPLVAGLDPGTLYAFGSGSLVAVDVTTGDVRRTDGIELSSSGPVEFAATSDGLVLRPLDSVPGVVVPDGKAPTPLAGLLRSGDQVLPGPDGHVWVGSSGDRVSMRLVDTRGRAVGPAVTATGSFSSDGRGGLLLADVGGVWQAYPGPLRRITTGAVAAAGPQHYRLTECDDRHRCWDELYVRSTGERRRLGPARPVFEAPGTISPDGRFAVSVLHSYDGTTVSQMARLSDGTVVRSFADPPDVYGSAPQYAVWLSARWLAVVEEGRVVLYDSRSAKVVRPRLSPGLIGLAGLVWRPKR